MNEEVNNITNETLERFICMEYDVLKYDLLSITPDQLGKKSSMIKTFINKVSDKTLQIEELKRNLKKENL
jgi:hypothetical protein